jgi:hypothetical protein
MRLGRVGGAKSLISAVTAPVSAGFVPTSVTSTRKATITATAFNGGVYAALPRVKNDDILAHAFCSKDVFFDERYGFNLPHVKESREDFAAAGKTYTKSLILDDDIVTSVPRLANALMFRHYASKADAMDTTPVMAVTMRLFFKRTSPRHWATHLATLTPEFCAHKCSESYDI